MTAKEIQQRNEKAQALRVIQVDDDNYFVESEEGKICYKVIFSDNQEFCTCGDYARNSKKDPSAKCKHLLAVMNCIPRGEVESGEFLEKRQPKLDERFVINIKGNDFIRYDGLLDYAHQKGLMKLECELVQSPMKENGNEAICRAIAVSKTGEVFSDIGDANPSNVSSMVVKHFIRIAATRAKARCLRDMTSVGMVALEELGDFDDVIGSHTPRKTNQEKPTPETKTQARVQKPKPVKNKPTETKVEPQPQPESAMATKDDPISTESKKPVNGAVKPESEKSKHESGPVMSEAQKRAIANLSRRRNMSMEDVETLALENYGVALDELTPKDASTLIRQLQQAA